LITLGMVALFLPSFTTGLFGDGLAGYEADAPAPEASPEAWLGRTFQNAADEWFKERFGMRFFFVKLNNQIDYSVFGKVFEGEASVAFGKDEWLYENFYIESYCHELEPTPVEEIRAIFVKARAFQDLMDARGVPFFMLISPSKVVLYPEHLPEGACAPHDGGGADYDAAIPILEELGVRYVDGYEVTRQAMPLWPDVTLFTRGGTHWNNLGAYYSAAAIIEQADQLSSKRIPGLKLGEVVIDNRPTGPDRDLVSFLNLLFPPTDFPTAHPAVSMEPSPSGPIKGIFVGMSFLEQIMMLFAQTDAFEQLDHYWYYHHEIRDALRGTKTPIEREQVDWAGQILAADFVVLDVNMHTLRAKHAERFLDDGLAKLAPSAELAPSP